MAYQSCQHGNSPPPPPPPPPICALTVHAPQTSILRQQGGTCTPRQALFSDLSTFFQAITRDYHHILPLGDFNTYSELPQIDQHQPFPLSSPHPMGSGVLVNQAFCLMWQHYNKMKFFKLDVSTLSIKHLLIGETSHSRDSYIWFRICCCSNSNRADHGN